VFLTKMDLLSQTLGKFFNLIPDKGVSLNLDIFETNLINITLLAGGLFYLLSCPLSEALFERQQKIRRVSREYNERFAETIRRGREIARYATRIDNEVRWSEEKKREVVRQVTYLRRQERNREVDWLLLQVEAHFILMQDYIFWAIFRRTVRKILNRTEFQMIHLLPFIETVSPQMGFIDNHISRIPPRWWEFR
jgi:hypothetical protein